MAEISKYSSVFSKRFLFLFKQCVASCRKRMASAEVDHHALEHGKTDCALHYIAARGRRRHVCTKDNKGLEYIVL